MNQTLADILKEGFAALNRGQLAQAGQACKRAIELDERLGSRRRGTFTGEELCAVMTTGGASALGLPNAGLAMGAPADFMEVDTSSVRLAGHDPAGLVDALVYAAAPADVRTVVVAGVERVRDGSHVSIETATELDRAIRQVMGT